MAVSTEFLDYIAEQLEPFGRFSIRRMFSGAGLFRDGLMFALAIDDVLYLKADDANRGDFERAGTGPYTYLRAGRERSLGYYEVPVDVLEDAGALALWARNAHGAALRAARSHGVPSPKRPSRGRPTRRR